MGEPDSIIMIEELLPDGEQFGPCNALCHLMEGVGVLLVETIPAYKARKGTGLGMLSIHPLHMPHSAPNNISRSPVYEFL
jgi:hypothetical protein